MKINLQNYEEYLVQYLDGELTREAKGEVESFLEQHPHLRGELAAFKATMLSVDDSIFFPGKELLKKGITPVNYEDYFIRKVEGNLSAEESNELSTFLRHHPALQREMNAFLATKLVADSSIVFPDKKSLKKKEDGRVVPMYVRYVLLAAVAASLMLIVLMRGVLQPGQPVSAPVAQESSSPSSQPAEKNSDRNTIETGSQVKTEGTELASVPSSPASNEKEVRSTNSRNKEASQKKNPELLAVASDHQPAGNDFTNPDMANAEMVKIGNDVQPINYQARFKKVPYRSSSFAANQGNRVEGKPAKFTSLATALGGELLRLSGREDYLKNTSAFNDTRSKDKKLPLVLSLKGEKFDFYHKFFKKRNQSSESKQN